MLYPFAAAASVATDVRALMFFHLFLRYTNKRKQEGYAPGASAVPDAYAQTEQKRAKYEQKRHAFFIQAQELENFISKLQTAKVLCLY